MKKTGLFKIIMFVLLGIVLSTWIFSASYFNNGEIADVGMYNIGFFDYFQLLFGTFEFTYFIQIFILLVSIGALYGVLGKTGKYRAWIERIATNCKGNEFLFLIITSVTIATLSSVFDFSYILFIFFPIVISIILALGYDKITAAVATFGAMLVGTIGTTISSNTAGTINGIIGVDDISTGIILKVLLLVCSLVALILYLYKVKRTKKVDRDEEDLFIGEKISNKHSISSVIVVLSLVLLVLLLSCTTWGTGINAIYIITILVISFFVTLFTCSCRKRNRNNLLIITLAAFICITLSAACIYYYSSINEFTFTEIHKSITEWSPKLPYFHITAEKIDVGTAEVAIFEKIFGTISTFGEWKFAEMGMVCLLASLLLGFLYKFKISETFEYMAQGAKKMLKPALMLILAYTVIYFSGNTMFYPTIATWILKITKSFNIITSSISMALGSALHVDILYAANYVIPQIAAKGANDNVIMLLSQGIYGVTMLITPTSAVLVFGLTYLDIPYKDWVKKTWKLILTLLIIVIVISTIATFIK